MEKRREQAPPTVLMVMICLHCALGGAEKRYARVFEHLAAAPGSDARLLINRSMLSLLQAAGILCQHEKNLIVLEPPSERSGWARGAGGRVSASPLRRRLAALVDGLWYVQQCWRVIARLRPQVVHPLLTGIYLSLPVLTFYPAIRRVMSAYSYQFESYRDRRVFGRSLGATVKRWAMQRADLIEALSETIRQDLVARGLDPRRIVVAPGSFTDLSTCRPAAQKQSWIVFAGRFVDIKNPLLLVEALPAVFQAHPGSHVFFLGDGPLEAEMRRRVYALGVDAQVSIRFEPQPTRLLNESSIFVSLQAEENYPSQSLLEAMACGNAIVATDVGETWRLVDDTVGVRVPATPVAVAAAVNRLLAEGAEGGALAARQRVARQRVLSEHKPEHFLAYMTSVYQTAWQARRRYDA